MRIGRSSSRPQPLADDGPREVAADVAPAARCPPRSRPSAVAPSDSTTPRHAGRPRSERRPASAPGASTCTYIVSEPRSRAVRLSGVSTATTRPLLMMTTRWQVCDDLREDVRAQDDRVIAGEFLDELARFDDLLRVEAGGRLVEDQDVGVVDERLRQADALPVALRELARRGGSAMSAMRVRSITALTRCLRSPGGTPLIFGDERQVLARRVMSG